MAGGRRLGGSGRGGGNYSREKAVFLDSIASGLGRRSGMSRKEVNQMKRVIASSHCDKRRKFEMFGFENSDEDSSEESEHVGPLHDAAKKGEMDTCKHLVENLGFAIDSVATDGSGTCFHRLTNEILYIWAKAKAGDFGHISTVRFEEDGESHVLQYFGEQ